jgi:hypothetical protein
MANRVTKVALAALAQRPKLPSSPAPKASGGAATELPYYPGLLGQHFADGGTPKAKRDLSDVGLYSHGAEVAAGLPQAKGSPQQFKAMLKKAGVKDAEFENSGFDSAFADRPSVTKDEIVQHFSRSMPKVEERVLGGNDIAYNAFAPLEEALQNHLDAGQIHNLELGRSSVNDLDPSIQPLAEEYLAAHKKWKAGWDRKDPKFSEYTLPGGENYREVLLKAPTAWQPKIEEKYGRFGFTGPDGKFRDYWTQPEAEQAAKSFYRDSGEYRSSHWDDPNVLAHLRMSDRTGPNGEKILHIEEVQSDWGQEGRKEGFRAPKGLDPDLDVWANSASKLSREEYDDLIERLRRRYNVVDANAENEIYSKQIQQQKSGIPSAPYVTSTQAWTDLALKRALKEAAEGGYDKIVWTPGEEQAKRYNLRKHIDELAHWREGDQIGLSASGPKGTVFDQKMVSPKDLPALVGQELSKKILSGEGSDRSISGFPEEEGVKFISGDGLAVGGEGMKSYYDKIVPTRLKELARKHDPSAQIGFHDILTKKGERSADAAALGERDDLIEHGRFWNDNSGEYTHGYRVNTPDGNELGVFEDLPDAHAALAHHLGDVMEPNQTTRLPALTVTPQMRQSIIQGGQPAFARGGLTRLHPAMNIPGVHIRTAEAGEPIFHGDK